MPRFIVTGKYTTSAIKAMVENPSDREAAARAIVEAAGSDLTKVVRTTVYITDVAHWGAVNDVYRRVFGDHRPARSVVPVSELHYGVLVEIEAIAAI